MNGGLPPRRTAPLPEAAAEIGRTAGQGRIDMAPLQPIQLHSRPLQVISVRGAGPLDRWGSTLTTRQKRSQTGARYPESYTLSMSSYPG